jgi:hypothetical protein
MACGDCTDCACGVTGGMATGDGMRAFLDECGDLFATTETDLLWELAANRVVMDPTEPLEVWEHKVAAKYHELRAAVERTP